MANKLALLLALAIGGLALCDGYVEVTPSSPPPPSPPPPPCCRCEKDNVTFFWNGVPVCDIILCPGKPLPDKTKYTARDNCGNILPVEVQDTPRRPFRCCTITRSLTAPCLSARACKFQKITFKDSITFSTGCPVTATSSCCETGPKVLTPALSYANCVFKAVYNVKDACGVVQTKTVTGSAP